MKIRFKDVLYIKGRIGWQALKKNEYLPSGDYYLITGVDIKDNHLIDFSNCYYVSKERYEMDEKIQVHDGDIIVTKDGTIGKIGYIDKLDKPATLNSHLFLIRNTRKDILDSKYLFYLLQSDMFKKYAINNTSGSNIPAFTQKNIEEFEYDLPPLERQSKIANCISLLDSKINTNIMINDNLQQQINDIYSMWFNQFEFPNDINKPYKTSGGRLIYNQILKQNIPERWNVASIANNPLCSFIDVGLNNFSIKNYLATANVNGTTIIDGDNITFENRESRANMQPALNTVWFAKMKNSIKHIFISSKASWMIDKYIFSTGFSGLHCDDQSFSFIASTIMQPYFEATKDVLSHGATQEGVNNDDLDSIPLLIPSKEVLDKYTRLVKCHFEKMNSLMLETQKLSNLRDELLPLLMNGQVSIV